MKRFLTLLLTALLALTAVFAFAACGDEGENNNNKLDNPGTSEVTGMTKWSEDLPILTFPAAADYTQLTSVYSSTSGDDHYEIFDLANYIAANGDVYLKFADADTSNGNGANVYFAELCNNYAPYSSENNYGQSDAGSKVDMAADTMVQAIDLADAGLYTV